jgi:uncharacterized protein YecE (DUF72 family)
VRSVRTGGRRADARRVSTKRDRKATASDAGRARRDVYRYFDDDAKVKAPSDALTLTEKLSTRPARHAAR